MIDSFRRLRGHLLKIIFLFMSVVCPTIGSAQTIPDCDGRASYSSCRVTKVNLRALCNFVSGKSLADENSRFIYAAELALWKMSGAHPDIDSVEAAKEKIRLMWRTNRRLMTCNTSRMSGDIFMIAVNSAFPEFIEAIHTNYGLDLNHVEDDTGLTALDYVQSEIRRLEDSGLGSSADARALRGYYKSFRNLGMKHSAELNL